jgi:hypothetical protein
LRPGDFENKTHPGGAPEPKPYSFFAYYNTLELALEVVSGDVAAKTSYPSSEML